MADNKQKPIILRNADSDTPELWFYSEFGPDDPEDYYSNCISAVALRDALNQIGQTKKLNVHFNTTGGDIFEATPIYNLLKNFPAKKTAIIDGMALSCGSWVAQACDTIRIAENGMLMIHDPETMSYGNQAQLSKDAAMLGQVKQAILSSYASRTNKLSSDELSAAMSAETWYTSQEALDAGLVDSIDPNKSVTMCADPRRFRNAPSWLKKPRPVDDYKRIMAQRHQWLNEIESQS